jgi:lactate permease
MFEQVLDPVGGSLFASAIFAALPIVALFVLLGGLKLKAHWAALIALGVAVLVAIIPYEMPVGQALDSAILGACFGLFPIMWIVWNALWIYNMTDATGHFDVLRRSFASISDDQRIQAVIIAFSFGALMEALAGFGTPVAIAAPMLMAIGFRPLQAAALALVANTAPVAFGAIATPIITLGGVTGLPVDDLGAMVGRQTPFLALVVPLVLVGMVDGMRGVRETWPAALAGGVAFAVGQYLCSNFLTVELTDIVASLLSAGAIVALLRLWQPTNPMRVERAPGRPAIAGAEAYDPGHEADVRRRSDEHRDSRTDVLLAYAPYIIIIAVLSLAQWGWIKDALENATQEIDWPGLNVVNADGEEPKPATFVFNWLASPGTLLLISGLITMLVLRVSPGRAVGIYGRTLNQLKWAR